MRKPVSIHFIAAVLLSIAGFQYLYAQSPGESRVTGAISGKVVTDDGRPVSNAGIVIISAGGDLSRTAGRMAQISDSEGNFRVEGLDPRPHSIYVVAPGYVSRMAEGEFYYIGQSVTVTLVKGGVITGKVTGPGGEPLTGISVRLEPVREGASGGRMNPYESAQWSGRTTDDRGIYRIFGIPEGSYRVVAGGNRMAASGPTPFDARMAIYHPSSTRDTAAVVRVAPGEEVSGVDIRFRSERGSVISGAISGGSSGEQSARMNPTATIVELRKPETGETISSFMIPPSGGQNGYAFYGVANGAYEVVATRVSYAGSNQMISEPRKVTINGRDVTGFDLALIPPASIAGRVVLENVRASAEAPAKCGGEERIALAEEIALELKPEMQGIAGSQNVLLSLAPQFQTVPDAKGEFAFGNLRAGKFHLEASLPDESLYIKSITAPPPANPARDGFQLKTSEKRTGIVIAISGGAARLSGRVVAAGGVPANLKLHLVPAEPEAVENLLRYRELSLGDSGEFSLTGLAPGKYLILARPAPAGSQGKVEFRDPALRARLRSEAQAGNRAVDLKSCEAIKDFKIEYRGAK